MKSTLNVWLTPDEACSTEPTVQIMEVDPFVRATTVSTDTPTMNFIQCKSFTYVKVRLYKAAYTYVYVLDGMVNWFLEEYGFKEYNQHTGFYK